MIKKQKDNNKKQKVIKSFYCFLKTKNTKHNTWMLGKRNLLFKANLVFLVC